MNRKIAMVKTINGKAKVTIETADNREEMQLKNGACLVVVAPTEDEPEPEPKPEPQPEPDDEHLNFDEVLEEMNGLIRSVGGMGISATNTPNTYNYLQLAWNRADYEWNDRKSWMFSQEVFADVYDWNGNNTDYRREAYDALQAWLMAMCLTELMPTEGEYGNLQTRFFGKAFMLGGGFTIPIYGLDIRADPMHSRLVAGACYVLHRSSYDFADIDALREEVGGQTIDAEDWDDLGYRNETLYDDEGRRGYRTLNVGYLVNTSKFILNAPGPRIEGTTVCELSTPQEDGQPAYQFNQKTDNYHVDELVNDAMVAEYNMMAQTPLEEWQNYPAWKRNRLVNAAATVCCTYMYMFGRPIPVKQVLDGFGELPFVDGYPRYEFERCAVSDMTIDGPFSDLAGIYRYNVHDGEQTVAERFIQTVLDIADNSRFPTQDPNYGRCRPGCARTREGGELNPIHGAKENELYNISISAMVADTEEQREKILAEDGWAADSPRSYVSGHSTQIFTMAMMLGQMKPEKLKDWMSRAYDYSVNRSIARYHWNSDCIYGRVFATMILPILNAMTGIRSGYEETKRQVNGEEPSDTVISINVCIENCKGEDIVLDGDLCLILANPTKNGEYIGWTGVYNRTPHIRFSDCPVTIPAGGSKTFYGLTYSEDADIMDGGGTVLDHRIIGLGGRSPLADALVADIGRQSNVLLYVGGDSEVAVCDCMNSSIIFENECTYQIKVSS